MARVQANDITINAIKLGEGLSGPLPPVVFVHGLIMDNLSSYYYTVAPAISTETEVVLYDLRGHGLTDRPATGYTLDDALDDLEGLLATLHVPTPVVLVGNSVGGTIALHAAITRPELVAGIGLIEAHPVVEGWGDHLMADIEELVAGFDEPGVRRVHHRRGWTQAQAHGRRVRGHGHQDQPPRRPAGGHRHGRRPARSHPLPDAAALRRGLRHPRPGRAPGRRDPRRRAAHPRRLLPLGADGARRRSGSSCTSGSERCRSTTA